MARYLFFLFLLPLTAWAQSARVTLTGRCVDEEGMALPGASVVLWRASDSVFQQMVLTNGNGRFVLRGISADAYLLQVALMGYPTQWERLTLTEDSLLPDLVMTTADLTLDSVEIGAMRVPVRLKGDTIAYNADAFSTAPNANVEELLKQLPGIQVDDNGTIRAQGEQVQKVLVDGKEFFGNDPTIATKNLPADAVDEVEVYDGQSEFSRFTGFDDGQREKTINLTLKEDKKKGYFGLAEGGYGTDNRYQGKVSLNRFGGKAQVSAIGNLNNVNEIGFSFDEYLRFMGGLSGLSQGGGTMRIELDEPGGLPFGNGMQDGYLRSGIGGLNFNRSFGAKTDLQSSYFLTDLAQERSQSSIRETLTESLPFQSLSQTERLSQQQRHNLQATLRHRFDSMHQITLRTQISRNVAEQDLQDERQVFTAEGSLETQSERDEFSARQQWQTDTDLNWRKRWRKAGRSLTGALSLTTQQDTQAAHWEAVNQVGLSQTASEDQVSQRQTQDQGRLDYGLRVSYTEPLTRYLLIAATLSHVTEGGRVDQRVYDQLGVGSTGVEQLVTGLSNQYTRAYRYQRAALRLNYQRKKFKVQGGVEWQVARLQGELARQDTTITQSLRNLLPSMSASYDFTSSRSLRFRYNTSVRPPSLSQLQPLVDNRDPLRISLGNPDLQAEYEHRLSLNFLSFSQFSMINVFGNVSGTYTENRIINAVRIDSLFRQEIQPINTPGEWRMNLYTSLSMPLRWLKSRLELSPRVNWQRSWLWVNEDLSRLNRWQGSAELRISNRNKRRVDVSLSGEWGYQLTYYQAEVRQQQAFITQRYRAEVAYNWGKRWRVSSEADVRIYEDAGFAGQVVLPIWRASVSHFLGKNQQAELRLSAFDLLNRNQGVSRNSDLNYWEETQTLSLGRYVLMSLIVKLNTVGS